MPANDQPTILSNLNLNDCTKEQLSELWRAIDRRRAAISIAAELNLRMLVERLEQMADLGRFRISFPDESAINAERSAAIAYVRSQIEQAIKSVSARTNANISDALLDFERAAAFALRHDPNNEAWPELQRFSDAIASREAAINAPRGFGNNAFHVPDPPAVAPTVPVYPNRGYQYQGFGADVALELCRNSLDLISEQSRSQIRRAIQISQEKVILSAIKVARDGGLNPEA